MTGLAQIRGTRCFATIKEPVERTVPWGDVVTSYRTRTVGTIDLRYGNASTFSRRAGTAYPDYYVTGDEYWDLDSEREGSEVSSTDVVSVDELMARAEAYEEKVRIRESKSRDPETVHEDQTGLAAFEDIDQIDVNPEAIEADERIEHLPAFLPEDETPNVSKYDPTTGSIDECNDCNGKDPWLFPLERGVDALRPGSIEDGNPNFSHQHECDETRKCEVCGCPRCNAKSIEYRSTMTPAYRCNSCELEFHNTVKRERDDDQRVRLHWRCRHCGIATKAPFAGIPEDRLPEDIDF